jgi:hypothetical protein
MVEGQRDGVGSERKLRRARVDGCAIRSIPITSAGRPAGVADVGPIDFGTLHCHHGDTMKDTTHVKMQRKLP